jgi:hypothetical protein
VEKHHVSAAPPAALAAAKPKPSPVARVRSSSEIVRSAPTVVHPVSALSRGRADEARAQREDGAAKHGLGPRTTGSAAATNASANSGNRGQARAALAHAKTPPGQARAISKPARTSPAHTAKATVKTRPKATPKTTPKATPRPTAKPKIQTTPKTKKHTPARKPLRNEPVRPVTQPKSPHPDTTSSGRENPHG